MTALQDWCAFCPSFVIVPFRSYRCQTPLADLKSGQACDGLRASPFLNYWCEKKNFSWSFSRHWSVQGWSARSCLQRRRALRHLREIQLRHLQGHPRALRLGIRARLMVRWRKSGWSTRMLLLVSSRMSFAVTGCWRRQSWTTRSGSTSLPSPRTRRTLWLWEELWELSSLMRMLRKPARATDDPSGGRLEMTGSRTTRRTTPMTGMMNGGPARMTSTTMTMTGHGMNGMKKSGRWKKPARSTVPVMLVPFQRLNGCRRPTRLPRRRTRLWNRPGRRWPRSVQPVATMTPLEWKGQKAVRVVPPEALRKVVSPKEKGKDHAWHVVPQDMDGWIARTDGRRAVALKENPRARTRARKESGRRVTTSRSSWSIWTSTPTWTSRMAWSMSTWWAWWMTRSTRTSVRLVSLWTRGPRNRWLVWLLWRGCLTRWVLIRGMRWTCRIAPASGLEMVVLRGQRPMLRSWLQLLVESGSTWLTARRRWHLHYLVDEIYGNAGQLYVMEVNFCRIVPRTGIWRSSTLVPLRGRHVSVDLKEKLRDMSEKLDELRDEMDMDDEEDDPGDDRPPGDDGDNGGRSRRQANKGRNGARRNLRAIQVAAARDDAFSPASQMEAPEEEPAPSPTTPEEEVPEAMEEEPPAEEGGEEEDPVRDSPGGGNGDGEDHGDDGGRLAVGTADLVTDLMDATPLDPTQWPVPGRYTSPPIAGTPFDPMRWQVPGSSGADHCTIPWCGQRECHHRNWEVSPPRGTTRRMIHREEHDDGSTTAHTVVGLRDNPVRRRNAASGSQEPVEPNVTSETHDVEEHEPEEEVSEEVGHVRSRSRDRSEHDSDGHDGDDTVDTSRFVGMIAPAWRSGDGEVAREPLRSQLDSLAQRLATLRSHLHGDADSGSGRRSTSDWMALHGQPQAGSLPEQPICLVDELQGLRSLSVLRIKERLCGREPRGGCGSCFGACGSGRFAGDLPRGRDEREDHEGQVDGAERKRVGEKCGPRLVGVCGSSQRGTWQGDVGADGRYDYTSGNRGDDTGRIYLGDRSCAEGDTNYPIDYDTATDVQEPFTCEPLKRPRSEEQGLTHGEANGADSREESRMSRLWQSLQKLRKRMSADDPVQSGPMDHNLQPDTNTDTRQFTPMADGTAPTCTTSTTNAGRRFFPRWLGR